MHNCAHFVKKRTKQIPINNISANQPAVVSETNQLGAEVQPAVGYLIFCEHFINQKLAELEPAILMKLQQLENPFHGVVVFRLCYGLDVFYGFANANLTEIAWLEDQVPF